MGRKMMVRILSISLALVFLGVFVPRLTKGAVNPTSVPFGEVTVGSQESQVLNVSNPNKELSVKVKFYMNGGDCGFSLAYDGNILSPPAGDIYMYLPGDSMIEAGGSINVEVIFAPTDPPVECSAALWVIYEDVGAAQASLSGTGIEAPSVSPTVIIDSQNTNVENKLYENKYISEWTDECAVNARNHGQYVRCMALMTRKMRKAKVLEKEDRRAIMKAAAHANIPPVESGLEGLEYNGEPVTDLIKECKENAENNRQYRRCVHQLMKEMKKEGVIKTRKEKHQIRRYAARLRFHGGR